MCRMCRGTAILHSTSCPTYLNGKTCACTPRVCHACGLDRPFWTALLGIVLIVAACVCAWYALWMIR